MANSKKFIFVGGNARSGTTALGKLLNCHPKVLVLIERYLADFKKGSLRPEQFERDAVCNGRAPKNLEQFGDDLELRWDQAEFIGDKVPALGLGFDMLDEHFPGATLVYIVRNPIAVAASYDAREKEGSWKRGVDMAVVQWNKSVRQGLQRCRSGKPLIVLAYEDVFDGRGYIDAVWRSMGLDPNEADQDRLDTVLNKSERVKTKEMTRDDDLFRYVSMHAAFKTYRDLMDEFAVKPEAVGESSGRSSVA